MRTCNPYSVVVRALIQILLAYLWLPANTGGCTEINLPDESLVFLNPRGLFVASVTDGRVATQHISSLDRKPLKLGVSADHKVFWILNEPAARRKSKVEDLNIEVKFLDVNMEPPIDGDIALSPGGKTLVYVTRQKSGLALCSKELSSGESTILTSGWNLLMAPSWSPDGKMVAFYCSKKVGAEVAGGPRLVVVDISSREERQIAGPSKLMYLGGVSRYPPLWSPGNSKVFFEAWYGEDLKARGTYMIEIDKESSPVWITGRQCVSISNQDDTLYFTDSGGAHALALEDGKWRKTVVMKYPGVGVKISPSGKAIAYRKPRSGLYCRLLTEDSEVLIDKDYHGGVSGLYWVKTKDAVLKDADKAEEK